jgi:HEPN domain-containing protein
LGKPYPRTHAIADLLTRIEEAGVQVPEEVRKAAGLTDYAVSARYPGASEEVSEEEYRSAIQLARACRRMGRDSDLFGRIRRGRILATMSCGFDGHSGCMCAVQD